MNRKILALGMAVVMIATLTLGLMFALPAAPTHAAVAADCTGATSALIGDDGAIDLGTTQYGSGWPDFYLASQRAVPGGTFTANTGCVCFTSNGAGLASLPFNLVIYADNGGSPGALLASINGLTATNVPGGNGSQWYSFPANITLNASSVFVGVQWNTVVSGGSGVCSDGGGDPTFFSGDAVGWGGNWSGNIMLRLANYSAGGACSIADGRINPDSCPGPVALYCDSDTLEAWDIDPVTGEGSLAFTHSGLSDDAPAANTLLKKVGDIELWQLDTGEFQVNADQGEGKTYAFVFNGCPYNGDGYNANLDPGE